MVYFTSDLHMGHRGIITMQDRPFNDVEEMNRILIRNYNAFVQKNDTVYILGDICHHLTIEQTNELIGKMIRPIVAALVALAKMGVQIFVTTHDYFVQQEFNMLTVYPELNPEHMDIQFMSLYKDGISKDVQYEMKETALDLEHNAIMQEFDAMYDREQEIIYGN